MPRKALVAAAVQPKRSIKSKPLKLTIRRVKKPITPPTSDLETTNEIPEAEYVLAKSPTKICAKATDLSKTGTTNEPEHNQLNSENVSPKKRKLAKRNKTDMNATLAKEGTIYETVHSVTNKRKSHTQKANYNECEIVSANGGTVKDSDVDKNVPRKRKRRYRKQNNNFEADDEDTIIVPDSSENVSPKKRKIQCKHNEIKIQLANEVLRTVFRKKTKAIDIDLNVNVPTKDLVIVKEPTKRRSKKFNSKLSDYVLDNNLATANALDQNQNEENKQDVAKKKPTSSKNCKKKTQVEDTKKSAPLKPTKVQEHVNETKSEKRVLRKYKEDIREAPPIDTNAQAIDAKKPPLDDSNIEIDENTVNSRKSLLENTSACLSWTKDISSSSAVTCYTVNSNDYVRIDKKLPIIMLTDINNGNKNSRKEIRDDIFEDESIDSYNQEATASSALSSIDFDSSQKLNLSTSSLTSVTNNTVNDPSQKRKEFMTSKFKQISDNVLSKIKKFDMEINRWIGYDNKDTAGSQKFDERVFKSLKEESRVIQYCEKVKSVLKPNYDPESTQSIETELHEPNKVILSESSILTEHNVLEHTLGYSFKDEDFNQVEHNLKSIHGEINERIDNSYRGEVAGKSESFDQDLDIENNEDDDAISLFAESISSCYLDTSKRKSSISISANGTKSKNNSHLELNDSFNNDQIENVRDYNWRSNPNGHDASITNRSENKKERISINFADDSTNNFKIPITKNCVTANLPGNQNERRNTGNRYIAVENRTETSEVPNSNSRNRESQIKDFVSPVHANFVNKHALNSNNITFKEFDDIIEKFETNTSYALGDHTQQRHPESHIFDMCVYNLMSRCNRAECKYSHENIDKATVTEMLQDLREDFFIRECKFMLKNWPIRRRFAKCFVQECARRDSTRLLLLITKDIICLHWQNISFITEIVETALLHLNVATLDPHCDILLCIISPNYHLCDHFMSTISKTQNFSRFKNVFINLTKLMFQMRRFLQLDVATLVLERICILPYDEPLAAAAILVVTITNRGVFKLPMLRTFENLLLVNNRSLYEQLLAIKMSAVENTAPVQMKSARISSPVAVQTRLGALTPRTPTVSPDFIETDAMNNVPEPVTRKVTLIQSVNDNMSMSHSESEDSQKPYEPRNMARKWKKYRPQPSYAPLRPTYQRQRFAPRNYSGTPTGFRRF